MADELHALLTDMPDHLFAVVDGAFFDDIAREVAAIGLEAQPLYESEEGRRVGPHLIAFRERAALASLLTHIGSRPAAVFWSWTGQASTLRRHLRSNAMIDIPDNEGGRESVLLRYADANVVASLLDILDAAQRAQFMGEASAISMRTSDPVRTRFFPVAPQNGELRRGGFLRLSPEQLAATSAAHLERSRHRVAATLRRGAPDQVDAYSEDKLLEIVTASEEQGRRIGIRSERSHARWAYLNILTQGRVLDQPGVLDYMQDGKASPDRKVDLMLRSVIVAARRGAERPV